MGEIVEINGFLSLELRCESFAVVSDDAVCDERRMELDYRNVFPLKSALDVIEQSEQFKTWLRKRESR